MTRVVSRTVAALAASVAAGCGPTHYPVTGHVHFADGRPLTTGRVVVSFPDPMQSAWGPLREDGTFELGMLTPNDGLPAGSYKVAITHATTSSPDPNDTKFVPKPLIHARFSNPDTSGLVFEVPGQRVWDIVVEK